MLLSPSSASLIMLVGLRGDAVLAGLEAVLGQLFAWDVYRAPNADAIPEQIEADLDGYVTVVIGAADALLASNWLAALGPLRAPSRERVIVVVPTRAAVERIPSALREGVAFATLDREDSWDVAQRVALELDGAQLDPLASLVRTAGAKRSLEGLGPLSGDWGAGVDTIAVEQLERARVGDGGRRSNPLWARWVEQEHPAELARLEARMRENTVPAGASSWVAKVAQARPRAKKALPSKAAGTASSLDALLENTALAPQPVSRGTKHKKSKS